MEVAQGVGMNGYICMSCYVLTASVSAAAWVWWCWLKWRVFVGIDPVFPLTFLVNSWIPGILDTIFQATFLTALLLYWLCIYHGVRQVSTRLFTVNK